MDWLYFRFVRRQVHLQTSLEENWSDWTHSRQDGPDSPIEQLSTSCSKPTQICASESLSDQTALAAPCPQISPDKSQARAAFLLHSNKFTFSPSSRHSHSPGSKCAQSQSLFPAGPISSKEWQWRPGGPVGKTRSSAVWVGCWRLVGLFGLVLILYLCNRPLKVYQSALVTSQVGSEKSIYLWLGLESSYPGSTKSWDQIFLPMHPLFPPHCNPRILCPENHFCFGFSCLSSPLSLSPPLSRKNFLFSLPLWFYCCSAKLRAHVNRLGKRLHSAWMLRHYNNIAALSYFPRTKCILQESVIRGTREHEGLTNKQKSEVFRRWLCCTASKGLLQAFSPLFPAWPNSFLICAFTAYFASNMRMYGSVYLSHLFAFDQLKEQVRMFLPN